MENKKMFVLSLVAISLSSCCSIKIPKQTKNRDLSFASDLKADIKNLQSSGELGLEYKRKVDTSYAKLNDKNVALLMWLQAARCESKSGDRELAVRLYDYAMQSYANLTSDGGVDIQSTEGIRPGAPSVPKIRATAIPEVASEVEKTFNYLNRP